MLMINISPDVNRKQIWSLLKGHLDEKIVEQFPKITAWHSGLRKNDEDIGNLLKNPVQLNQNLSKIFRLLCHALRLWSLFVSLVKNPLHLVLPYLLVFHVAILNLVLGGSIALFTWIFEGESLLGGLPFHVPLWALWSAWGFSLLCAFFFLGIHFRSGQSQSLSERLGCASLAILILLLYSACPAIVLVVLVALQQVFVNAFMTKFFRTPSALPSAPAEPAEQTRWICPFLPEGGELGPHESEVDEGEGQP